jgi:hypothetical protein
MISGTDFRDQDAIVSRLRNRERAAALWGSERGRIGRAIASNRRSRQRQRRDELGNLTV